MNDHYYLKDAVTALNYIDSETNLQSYGSGVNDASTQRVTIATDDMLVASINTHAGNSETHLGAINTDLDAIVTSTASSDTKLGTVNTNLGTINTSIGTGNSTLATISLSANSIDTNTADAVTSLGTINTSIGTSNTNLGTINTSIGTTNTNLSSVIAGVNGKTNLLWRNSITVSNDGSTQNLERNWSSGEYASVQNTTGSTIYIREFELAARLDTGGTMSFVNFLTYGVSVAWSFRIDTLANLSTGTQFVALSNTYTFLTSANGTIIVDKDYDKTVFVMRCKFNTPIQLPNNSYIGFRTTGASNLVAGTNTNLKITFDGYY